MRGLSCPFTDAGGSWYTDAVIWAYHAGVVAGVSATQFAPNEALTREQMVTMLYGYAGREQLSGPTARSQAIRTRRACPTGRVRPWPGP